MSEEPLPILFYLIRNVSNAFSINSPAPRPIPPRTAAVRAAFPRARCHITGTEPPEPRPQPVPVTEAERLIIDVLGGTPIATLPLPHQEQPERTGIRVRGRDPQSKTGEGSRVRFIEIPPATA